MLRSPQDAAPCDRWSQCELERKKRSALLDTQIIKACAVVELCGFFIWICSAVSADFFSATALFLALGSWHMNRAAVEHVDKTVLKNVFLVFLGIGAASTAYSIGSSSMGLSSVCFCLFLLSFLMTSHSVRSAGDSVDNH